MPGGFVAGGAGGTVYSMPKSRETVLGSREATSCIPWALRDLEHKSSEGTAWTFFSLINPI